MTPCVQYHDNYRSNVAFRQVSVGCCCTANGVFSKNFPAENGLVSEENVQEYFRVSRLSFEHEQSHCPVGRVRLHPYTTRDLMIFYHDQVTVGATFDGVKNSCGAYLTSPPPARNLPHPPRLPG